MPELLRVILLVDPDPAVRRVLGGALQASGYRVACFSKGTDALARTIAPCLECAILDLDLVDTPGLELQRRLNERYPGVSTVFLTSQGAIMSIVAAVKQGAVDVLEKPVTTGCLLAAVEVAEHTAQEARRRICAHDHASAALIKLTVREREVLQYVIAGYLNKQVASQLKITEKTVKVHRARIMKKTLSRSVAELARLCWTAGVEPLGPYSATVRPQTAATPGGDHTGEALPPRGNQYAHR